MPLWLQIIIVASTLAGLGFAAFGMWMGAKQKQAQMGTTVEELQSLVEEQQRKLEAADRRFQNLETIVTSQLWDVVNDESSTDGDRQRALADASQGLGLDLDLDETTDSDQVEHIARRLRS